MLLGLARGRGYATMSLGRIAMHASHAPMSPLTAERMIGDALGDSTLELALWEPERDAYVDARGAPTELPSDLGNRRVTRVVRDRRPVAALIHGPVLEADSELAAELAGTSLMLLENARLVAELRASRARIVETAERERKRLERDLQGVSMRPSGLEPPRTSRSTRPSTRNDQR